LGVVGSKDYYRFVNRFEGDAGKALKTRNIGRILFGVLIVLNIAEKVFEDSLTW
jgi:hypothetical protein